MRTLDQFVHPPAAVERLRAGPLGAVLDTFVSDLQARGHAESSIRRYVQEAARIARWMGQEGRCVGTLDESALGELLAADAVAGRSPVQSAHHLGPAFRRLLATLRGKGLAVSKVVSTVSPVETWVSDFLEHAVKCRGVSAATCDQHGRYVREFLCARFSSGPVDVTAIQAHDVIAIVVALAERGHTRAAKCAATALRAFLRFLVLRGLVADQLVAAVPTVVHRADGLPRHLTSDQLCRLLASFDRSPTGRRDYAIALCCARLGLRAGEVVGLRLQDLAWRDGTLRIATGKSRRAVTLPVPMDVGRAVARYIRHGRPPTSDRHVFVTHLVPAGRELTRRAVSAAIRRAFGRAGINATSKGTHALRHTLATAMVLHGSSLKEVADVLRHRCLDTTAIYAKVDLPALRSVAMPWPEVG